MIGYEVYVLMIRTQYHHIRSDSLFFESKRQCIVVPLERSKTSSTGALQWNIVLYHSKWNAYLLDKALVKEWFLSGFPFLQKIGQNPVFPFFPKNRAKYLAYASLLTDFLPSAVKNWTHKHKRSVCLPFYCTMSTFISRKLALCFCRTVSTRDCFSVTDCAVVKVVLWSKGAHLTKPGWSKPHTHSTPLIWRYLGIK